MEYKQLKYFLVVSRCMKITTAAKELYITQQALSRSLINLEEELGAPLFIRDRRGLKLTPYGECLIPYAEKIMTYTEAAFSALERIRNDTCTHIRMGYAAGEFYAEGLLPPSLLNAFEKEHPGITVGVREEGPERLKELVLCNELDLAFIFELHKQHVSGLHYCTLAEEPVHVLVSCEHPLAQRKEVALNDLRDQPILMARDDPAPQTELEQMFGGALFSPKLRFFDGPYSHCLEHVRINEGITFCSLHRSRALHDPRLTAVRIADCPTRFYFSLIAQADSFVFPIVKRLSAFLAAHCQVIP